MDEQRLQAAKPIAHDAFVTFDADWHRLEAVQQRLDELEGEVEQRCDEMQQRILVLIQACPSG